MLGQHFPPPSPSLSAKRLAWSISLILTVQLLGCDATYNIFISSAQLEAYFQGTEEFSSIKDFQVDIIRDGKSQIAEDGSLQLVEERDNTFFSGSGQTPPPATEGPTEKEERRRRASSSLLSPMDSALPTLPSSVEELVLTWQASAEVSYQISLSDCPSNHFKDVGLSIADTGTIPLDMEDFSVLFPCNSDASGTGQLLVNLTTTVQETGEQLDTNFRLEKNCQVELPSTTSLLPSPSSSRELPLSTSGPFLTSSFSVIMPTESSATPSMTSVMTSDLTPTPSISEDEPLMPITSLLVEPSSTPVVSSSSLSSPSPIPSTTPAPVLPSPSPSSSPAPPAVTPSPSSSPTPPAVTPSPSSPAPPAVTPSPSSLLTAVMVESSTSVQPSVTPPPPVVPPTEETTEEPDDSFVQLAIIVFAPVGGVLVISICILLCSICICLLCCKKRNKRHFSDDPGELPVNVMTLDDYLYPPGLEMSEKKDEAPITLWMALNWGSICNLPAGIQGVIKRYSMDRRSLNILATVSRGNFGCIVNGQLSTDPNDPIGGTKGVTMKMYIGFQNQYGHCDEITKFLEHATLLKGVDHPNVQSFLHLSVEDNYVPIVAYPIMEYGNLQQFLALCRMAPSDSPLNPVTLQHKISFSYQIASGMKHLSENSIVHPDLALRNCYLDTNYQVKISDSALSQCFYPDCYFQVRGTVRPVRWSSIETLQEGLCTSQSNVWSYGVTMWEVMTLARLPYFEVDHNRNILTHLLMQNRLAQPNDCPDDIYALMQECWKGRAEDRPNFPAIYALMYNIHNKHAAAQSSAPPTATGAEEISYSTFGKDLRTHDAPPLETASVHLRNSFHRRLKSGGSLRGSVSRGSPANSQRNSVNVLDGMSNTGDQLSITFSVLSNENDLENSGSESEAGESQPKGGLSFEIPSFLTRADQEEREGKGEKREGEEASKSLYPTPVQTEMERRRAESPMDMVSTFLAGARPARTSLDQPDYATSTFTHSSPTNAQPTTRPPPLAPSPRNPVRPAPIVPLAPSPNTPTSRPAPVAPSPNTPTSRPAPVAPSPNRPAPLAPVAPSPNTPGRPAPLAPVAPSPNTPNRPAPLAPIAPSPNTPGRPAPPVPIPASPSPRTPNRPAPAPPGGITKRPSPLAANRPSTPLAVNGPSTNNNNNTSVTPDLTVPPAVSVTPSNQDTPSKPPTPDSTTYSVEPHPPSHIPGLPASTFNKMSVSIDDVKLRNKQFLDANGHAGKSASVVSTTPSGASKSDSGIRSDEEVESVLSNGMQSSSSEAAPTPVVPPVGGGGKKVSVDSMGPGKDSDMSLGITDLSSDLMATFATWGK